MKSELGPGCFVNLTRIGRSETDLNQSNDIELYEAEKNCSLKPGEIVEKQMTNFCCPTDNSTRTCGEFNSDHFCFTQPVWQEIDKPLDLIERARKQGRDLKFLEMKKKEFLKSKKRKEI